ncbi:MAG TPA: MBG domain-containing protein, partial [Cyclobacteriaceae bacterium]|nr:MBG domain-containing protein [Cyclobacteriaceae bacterium]
MKGALICVLVLLSLQTKAANFYWLAAHYDNNWFDGRNWSHTPGGTAIGNSCSCAGTDFPGSNDDVYIDASIGGQISFAGLAIQMKSMTWSGTPTATTELYGYGAMSVFGSLVFVSNMKVNISYLNLYGSGGADVITTAGNDMKDCALYIGSGNYALTGDYTASGNFGTIGIGGTFSTNNHSILANDLTVSNSSAVIFNMGSSTIQVVNFNMNYTPGSQTLTINPGTSSVNFFNNFIGSNKTYYSVTKIGTSGSGLNLIGGGNTFTNLTINAGVSCVFSGGVSQTITGSLTVVGTSVNRITLGNYGAGSFTLIAPNGSAMAYVDITNGIANNTGTANEFTTTNSTKTNCHGWDRTSTPITFANVNKNYGAASFSMTASSTSTGAFTYSITSGNSFATINATSGAVSIAGAGAVTVKASQAGDLDYLPNTTTATLTIATIPLTITANNKSRLYGAANPTFDFNYSGFVNSETSSVLSSLPTASTSATAASGVNTYAIVPSGGSAANYSFSFVNGTLTVTPAPI